MTEVKQDALETTLELTEQDELKPRPYVVIDEEGKAANIVLWDGVSDWKPDDGCTLALEDSEEAQAAIAAAQPAEEPLRPWWRRLF